MESDCASCGVGNHYGHTCDAFDPATDIEHRDYRREQVMGEKNRAHEIRPTAYTVYVHTYPGVDVYTTSQDGPLAVLHVDECAIMVRDVDTADKLIEAAIRARTILEGQWPPKVGL